MNKKTRKNPVPTGVYLYYLREDKQIVGSVAFRPNNDGTVNRGIAITGIGESGSRDTGRMIAINRLDLAETDGESTRPINTEREACERFVSKFFEDTLISDQYPLYKCAIEEQPTDKEAHILECVSGE